MELCPRLLTMASDFLSRSWDFLWTQFIARPCFSSFAIAPIMLRCRLNDSTDTEKQVLKEYSFLQVAQGVQDTLLSIDLLKVDQPTQKEVNSHNMK